MRKMTSQTARSPTIEGEPANTPLMLVSEAEFDCLLGFLTGVSWSSIGRNVTFNSYRSTAPMKKLCAVLGGVSLPSSFPCEIRVPPGFLNELYCWNRWREEEGVAERKYAEAEYFKKRAEEVRQLLHEGRK